jgi:nicotinate dehydrogenase subunit B
LADGFAAAEARRILIDRASSILKTPASALMTESGSVCVKAAPGQRVAYKDLIGSGFFEAKLEWNGQVGNLLVSKGVAQPKPPSEYKLVGKSVPRTDIGDNVYGRHAYVTDIRLPNMLHARVIRPPIVGAEPVSIETSSLKAIPTVQVIHERGIVAVLAEANGTRCVPPTLWSCTGRTPSSRSSTKRLCTTIFAQLLLERARRR